MSKETRAFLGSQLLEARKGRRLRLSDVAQRSGRQPARLSEIETGKANSTIDTISEAAAALGMTLVLVPIEKLGDAMALSRGAIVPPARPFDVPGVLQDVFVNDDGAEDDEEDDLHARP